MLAAPQEPAPAIALLAVMRHESPRRLSRLDVCLSGRKCRSKGASGGLRACWQVPRNAVPGDFYTPPDRRATEPALPPRVWRERRGARSRGRRRGWPRCTQPQPRFRSQLHCPWPREPVVTAAVFTGTPRPTQHFTLFFLLRSSTRNVAVSQAGRRASFPSFQEGTHPA